MEKKDRKIGKIRSGLFLRGATIAKMSLAAGSKWTELRVTNLFRNEDARAKEIERFIIEQAELLTTELGLLKGSMMKAGQLLSTYGEHFLPPKVNVVLKRLQSDTPPVDWVVMERVVMESLSKEALDELVIEPQATASASMGQVHRAVLRSTGTVVALKIQYPGVAKAIDSDLRALRSLLTMARLLPTHVDADPVFDEVRDMLHQELDFNQELLFTEEYRNHLAAVPAYVVPQPFPQYSCRQVLATEFIEGVPLDGAEVAALTQERRNHLASLLLDLLFREIFSWHLVQTDPHFGNYKVLLGDGSPQGDRLVLLDFGALRRLDPQFVRPYRDLVTTSLNADKEGVLMAAKQLSLLKDDDSGELFDLAFELARAIMRPFLDGKEVSDDPCVANDGTYDWGASNLPDEVMHRGYEILRHHVDDKRRPPRELVFLDRKVAGTFVAIAKLRAKIRGREILLPYLE